MVMTLRESKARLSELVERASRGEDVLISVRGQVKARLTRVTAPGGGGGGPAWARSLRALHKAYSRSRGKLSTEEVLGQLRDDRF